MAARVLAGNMDGIESSPVGRLVISPEVTCRQIRDTPYRSCRPLTQASRIKIDRALRVIAAIPLISTNDLHVCVSCEPEMKHAASARVLFRRMQARVNACNGRARFSRAPPMALVPAARLTRQCEIPVICTCSRLCRLWAHLSCRH
jgi:hypothetical protein